MNNTLVVITTFNREKSFTRLYESIDKDLVDVLVCICGTEDHPYKNLPEEVVQFKEKKPVVFLKKAALEYAKEIGYEHLFIIEDDVVIKDNAVWGLFTGFSEASGIKHTNWNSCVKNEHILDYEINEDWEATVHRNAMGCFQYFEQSIYEHVTWDTGYINAFEHGDVEYDLSLKKLIPPFWYSVSVKGADNYLEYDDGGESTITGKHGYSDNVQKSLRYWISKWGVAPAGIEIVSPKQFMRSVNIIKRKYGVTEKPSKPESYNPVSIIVTIKDRCLINYKPNELLPQELQQMQQHDALIAKVNKANTGRNGVELNLQIMKSNGGFRLFDNFLKTVNEQAHKFKGEVELIISDWGSTDDNVDDVVNEFWDHDYTIIHLSADEKFSRGHGLNEAIKVAKYEHLHISDVDMTYYSPRFLEECSVIDQQAIFPIISKQLSPSGLFLYLECAGFGIASLEKSTINKVGGFEDIRKWGGEDNQLFDKVDELLGRDNVKRTVYNEAIHQWHSDSSRDYIQDKIKEIKAKQK